ncbi:MAG: hypothetical protein CMO82_11115 [Winogradskyella sp.]|jgi:hypothetical protein|nr:hypothetical protein [Winogradskyella sp.]|tara:strand:- start:1199 stop:1471 length:273 start_codon:yes stop_codon:yes gene_type:complete
MDKIRETFLKKYGVWEYVLFLVGIAILGRVVYSIIIADFKTMTWDEIGIIILFLSLGVLAVAKPLAIADYARKKVGLETKDKSKNERIND